jgi:hypothetical protein
MQVQSVREPQVRPPVSRQRWARHAENDGEGATLALYMVEEADNGSQKQAQDHPQKQQRQFTSNPAARQHSEHLTRISRLIASLRLADDALLSLEDFAQEFEQQVSESPAKASDTPRDRILQIKSAFQEKEKEVQIHLRTFQEEAGIPPPKEGFAMAAATELSEKGGDMSATFQRINDQRANINIALRELEKSVKRSVWQRYNGSDLDVLDDVDEAAETAQALSERIDSVHLSALQAQANLDAGLVFKLLEVN